jgi:hypothetical protein
LESLKRIPLRTTKKYLLQPVTSSNSFKTIGILETQSFWDH